MRRENQSKLLDFYLLTMEQKVKRVWIRLSPQEEAEFLRKAQSFPSMSAMIRKAVELLDNEGAVQRLERMKSLTKLYHEFDSGLAIVGNNLNQAVRNFNRLTAQAQVTTPFITDVVYPAVKDTQVLVGEIKNALKDAVKSSVR